MTDKTAAQIRIADIENALHELLNNPRDARQYARDVLNGAHETEFPTMAQEAVARGLLNSCSEGFDWQHAEQVAAEGHELTGDILRQTSAARYVTEH
jgi:hypothetical protein